MDTCQGKNAGISSCWETQTKYFGIYLELRSNV
jgi:hypothetical protein